jgi:MoaA/NifB/PqqE/SkfB family radical SAM enzyme
MGYPYKISMAQIDPNGLCNVGCWFCPVRYVDNPLAQRTTMPIETFENIINQLVAGRGTFVSENFDFIYTAHYNEVLLYKYFPEMLEILRKNKIKTIILTNGTSLTKARTDLIKEYQDVVYGICFNMPASEPEEWARATNKPVKMFDKLIEQVSYAVEQLPEMIAKNTLSIQVNGINKNSLVEYGGWIQQLINAPEMDMDPITGTLATMANGWKEKFPQLNIYEMPYLVDRNGQLDTYQIITNIGGIKEKEQKNKTKVVGCGNGKEVGGRPNGWLHVAANGDTFICCNDYDFETVFGNINDKPISDIWMSIEHKMMTAKSFDNFCKTCVHAIWGD